MSSQTAQLPQAPPVAPVTEEILGPARAIWSYLRLREQLGLARQLAGFSRGPHLRLPPVPFWPSADGIPLSSTLCVHSHIRHSDSHDFRTRCACHALEYEEPSSSAQQPYGQAPQYAQDILWPVLPCVPPDTAASGAGLSLLLYGAG